MRVNGEVIREMGVKVDPETAVVLLDDERVRLPKLVYFIANKPKGTVSTSSDPHGRPTVINLLPKGSRERVFVVGRLDRESTGLVLLTNNGELAQRMTHPRYQVIKRYHVRVKGYPDATIVEKLRKGVWLAEGKTPSIEPRVLEREGDTTLLEIDLSEGTNRILRRVLAKVGLRVRRLTRVAMGPLMLGELRFGEARPLTEPEVSALLGILEGENLVPAAAAGRREMKYAAQSRAPRRPASGSVARGGRSGGPSRGRLGARSHRGGARNAGGPRGAKRKGPSARGPRAAGHKRAGPRRGGPRAGAAAPRSPRPSARPRGKSQQGGRT